MISQLYHKYDTNSNESLNRSATSYAPKDRTYSMSMSLATRIKIVAGVQLVGPLNFWTDVHERMKLPMSSPLKSMLTEKGERRSYMREYQQRSMVSALL